MFLGKQLNKHHIFTTVSADNVSMSHLLIPFFIIFTAAILIPNAFAQEATIPSWIKNNAGWWASDQIPDSAFLQGIQYLIKEGIMVIPTTESSESSGSQEVPAWIKNNAKWWSAGIISDENFLNGIKYLVISGIINVDVQENSEIIKKELERTAWNFERCRLYRMEPGNRPLDSDQLRPAISITKKTMPRRPGKNVFTPAQ